MDDLNQFVPNVRFEKIQIKNLVSNQQYQRNLSEKHIHRTVEEFDLRQINPVKVSRRDGINYVFNGQHTIEIVAMASGSRETPVWCMVYEDMDYEGEADTFANQQKNVKPLTSFEIFNANLEAGNDKQLMIKALVESMNLAIANVRGSGKVAAVSTLEQIYDKYGYHVLDRCLRLCVGTWEGERNSLSSGMLRGVCRLIVTYGDEMRDDLFKNKVGRYSAKEISRKAKDRHAGSLGYAEAMILAYNARMKGGCLHWSKLYNKKGEDMENMDFIDLPDNAEYEDPWMDEELENQLQII